MKKSLLALTLSLISSNSYALERNVNTYPACSNLNVEITETIELMNELKVNLDNNIDKIPKEEFIDSYNLLLRRELLQNIKDNISTTKSCDTFIRSALIPKVDSNCTFNENKTEWFVSREWVCPNEFLGKANILIPNEQYKLELNLDLETFQKELISIDTNILSSTRKQVENAFYKQD